MIQPEGPGGVVTCPKCGHQDAFEGDATAQAIVCSECRAETDFGLLRPTWTNQPLSDHRFISVRVDTVVDGQPVTLEVPLYKDFARKVAMDMLAICR